MKHDEMTKKRYIGRIEVKVETENVVDT